MELWVFEVNGILENQLIGGIKNNWSVTLNTHLSRQSFSNMSELGVFNLIDIKTQRKTNHKARGKLKDNIKLQMVNQRYIVSLMDMIAIMYYFDNVIKPITENGEQIKVPTMFST